MKKYYIFLFSLSLSTLSAQSYKTNNFTITKVGVVYPANIQAGFNAIIKNVEAPSPDGDSYKSFLMRQKIKGRKLYPRKAMGNYKTTEFANDPVVGRQDKMYRIHPNGSVNTVVGGIPNDNSMAISNGGILIAGINSSIWAYDYNTDSTVFPFQIISLKKMSGDNTIGGNYYDPKLIYDPLADRFILTFLKGNTPSSSKIFLCFSSTNNPNDPWYVYSLPGNPLNNNRWTDYPAVSLTEKDFFVTGNLIIPGVSWQIGFDGSLIWQVNKEDGYNNAATLSTTLFSQIKHNGQYTRNVHPVRGAEGIAETQYFLSNRNFDLTNDTIFVMHLTGDQDDPNNKLIVDYGVTDTPYGFPPNGQQSDTDTTDPTSGLQTNDARVLGAFSLNNNIQFVANTVNPATGLAAIYHGFILNPHSEPHITGTILGHNIRDFGYPNIAFTGNQICEAQAIIGFDFTSVADHPGVAVMFFDNDSNYSAMKILKQGENYVDRHSDGYERWGDYFGIQRKFNQPGAVYTTGYYGLSSRANATWFSEVFSPDTNALPVSTAGAIVYPNPVTATQENVNIEFTLDKAQNVTAYIYNLNGQVISQIAEYKDCVGTNLLTFSTYPLSSGTFVLRLYNQNGEIILRQKFIKY